MTTLESRCGERHDDEIAGPLISVIVPVHDAMPYLEQCIASILGQTYANLEVILVDNGSSDGSSLVCDEFSKADERLSVLHTGRLGPSGARNLGLSVASGMYVQFVDSDDYLEPNATALLAQALQIGNSDLAICGFTSVRQGIQRGIGATSVAYIPRASVCQDRETFLLDLLQNLQDALIVPVWNKLYRTLLIRKLGLEFRQDLEIAEDYIFNIEYLSAVNKVTYVSHSLYNYRASTAGSLTSLSESTVPNLAGSLEIRRSVGSLLARGGVINRVQDQYADYIVGGLHDFLLKVSIRLSVSAAVKEMRRGFASGPVSQLRQEISALRPEHRTLRLLAFFVKHRMTYSMIVTYLVVGRIKHAWHTVRRLRNASRLGVFA